MWCYTSVWFVICTSEQPLYNRICLHCSAVPMFIEYVCIVQLFQCSSNMSALFSCSNVHRICLHWSAVPMFIEYVCIVQLFQCSSNMSALFSCPNVHRICLHCSAVPMFTVYSYICGLSVTPEYRNHRWKFPDICFKVKLVAS